MICLAVNTSPSSVLTEEYCLIHFPMALVEMPYSLESVIVCKAVIQSEVKYNEQILSTVNNYWNKLLKASDFEATWTQYVNALKRNGIEEIVKERTAYYNKYIKNK